MNMKVRTILSQALLCPNKAKVQLVSLHYPISLSISIQMNQRFNLKLSYLEARLMLLWIILECLAK
jgi:hypothetical protein